MSARPTSKLATVASLSARVTCDARNSQIPIALMHFKCEAKMVISPPNWQWLCSVQQECPAAYRTYIQINIANNAYNPYIHDAIASYIVELKGFALTCNASAAASLSDTVACSCSMLESLAARVD